MSNIAVPYMDFGAQHHHLQADFEAAFREISLSGQFILGPHVSAFEQKFAEFCGVDECIAVNSGTSALHLALLAAGVGVGDEVITTPSTFVATIAAISYTGATPVFVDIDPKTYCLNPQLISQAITERTKAIIPVHLYGTIADMPSINALATQHDLTVIEDAAQAHGARLEQGLAGSLGSSAGFSFYPGKNLGAFGEGGAITTSDPEMATEMRSLRDWGQSGKGNHIQPAYNYRMDAIQGAMLGIKLAHLRSWTEARQSIAHRYEQAFEDLPLKLQSVAEFTSSAWHVYSIRLKDREGLRKHLLSNGIQSGIHYPQAVHRSPAYHYLGYAEGTFPHAEALAVEELSLPIYPGMTDAQVEIVISAVRQFAMTDPSPSLD
jgi:dTDP-4-amino-4,6-dideoxygalactose transaminase